MSIREEEKEELVVDVTKKPNTLSPEKTFGYGPQGGIGDFGGKWLGGILR